MLKRQSTVIPSLIVRIASSVDHLLSSKMPCYVATSDPFCKRLFHTQAIDLKHAFPFIPRSSSVKTSRYGGDFAVNTGKSNGLTLKGCYDSHKTVDQKSRPLAQHRQLMRGLELSPTEEHNGTNLANGRGAYQPGKPFGFPGSDKIVVAVDVDEVLGNFVSALNRFIADRYSMNHSVSEYHVYEFFKIWNCSRDEAALRVHEFFQTPYFKKGIQPIPGAHQALHKLSRFCNLSVVTSRQNVIKDHTIEWIEKHFPGLFEEIHFGNHFALHGGSRPKAEICRSIGAEILIDDNPGYAVECAEVGMKVLLFDYENSYPWCKTDSVNKHPLVTKVYNWEEVEENIASWAVSQR